MITPKRLVVDSSIFVAAFRHQEQYSDQALVILEQLQSGMLQAVVPVSVVVEVVAAIRRRTGQANLASSVGQILLTFPFLSLIDITTSRMLRYLDFAQESGLAGMDVLVLGVAEEFDLPLVTLDKELARKAERYVSLYHLI